MDTQTQRVRIALQTSDARAVLLPERFRGLRLRRLLYRECSPACRADDNIRVWRVATGVAGREARKRIRSRPAYAGYATRWPCHSFARSGAKNLGWRIVSRGVAQACRDERMPASATLLLFCLDVVFLLSIMRSSSALQRFFGSRAAVEAGVEAGVLRVSVSGVAGAALKKIRRMLDSGWIADHNLVSLLQRMQRFFKKLNNR